MSVGPKIGALDLDRRDLLRGGILTLGALGTSALRPLLALGDGSGYGRDTTSSSFSADLSDSLLRAGSASAAASFTTPGSTMPYPAPEIRIREGEVLRVTLANELPEPTTIHWHGIPLPNPMDGIPEVTQPPVAPGSSFVYEFRAAPAGSYLYHSHFGLQLDRGLTGPLIVEEVTSHISWDREYTVFLDDFLPGEPPPARRRHGDGRTNAALRRALDQRQVASGGACLLGARAANASGCASSTVPAPPPSAWPCPGIGSR